MPLEVGTKLGTYAIQAAIGTGGIEFLIRVKPFLEKNASPAISVDPLEGETATV